MVKNLVIKVLDLITMVLDVIMYIFLLMFMYPVCKLIVALKPDDQEILTDALVYIAIIEEEEMDE